MSAPNTEKWVSVSPKYQVSNCGRVRSRWKVLKNHTRKEDSYSVVNAIAFGEKKRKLWRVHRLVAMAFIDKPKNLDFINHKNGDKSDNRVENLEWCNYSQNHLHAYKTGLKQPVCNFEGKNGFAKKVMDYSTMNVYDSLSQVIRLKITKHKYSALRAMLSGQSKNKTTLSYC